MAGTDDLTPWAEPTANPQQGGPDLFSRWGQALEDPSTRASLLQIGLQLMQPMGFGQSPMGHLAQAIGAGGEAASRIEAEDTKNLLAGSKIAKDREEISQGRQRIAIGERNATTREKRAAQGTGGLSLNSLFRADQQRARNLEQDAKWAADKVINELKDAQYLPPGTKLSPEAEKHRGKSPQQIQQDILQELRSKSPQAGVINDPKLLPPPNQRIPGKTIVQTPRGPHVWTDQGWVPVTQGSGGGRTRDEDEEV
jgi:hypothetical protein